MKKLLKSLAAIALLLACYQPAYAQSEPEYLMEIGGGVGLTAYQGDFNASILRGMTPTASVVLRRLLNPRQGFKFELGATTAKGSSKNTATFYPDYGTGSNNSAEMPEYAFKRGLFDICATYEQNFWPYGTGREYRGAKRLTPYIFVGLGFTLSTGQPETAFAPNMPIGFGVKYKIADRMNLDVNWGMRLSMTDKIDGVADPYGIQSSGLFKNTDCYSVLKVALTYSFKEKCRVCHNADE